MRDRIIRIRASIDEMSKIEELAKGRGLSISEMMRRAAFGVRMPARTFDATHITLLTCTLAELGRIGGNLNQMVRRANSGKLAGHDADLSNTLSGIDTLRDRLRDIMS
ncbi:MobC family plasmid mobilization relaxosome protein [Rhizobium sp. NZLR8]|uniref:plasmid mobilization protein n=1 Tax=Rhizobium sp. NZLR8 TaxID=2731104 RepID=UPI001C828D7B|nr:plasmid mobilization relaxosome protein MobC [Rhizobium sp. NZLR8]MBX5160569.1 MobC family plasmid mobilization relaxosome protein [Rhizobium sp. NZLR8]